MFFLQEIVIEVVCNDWIEYGDKDNLISRNEKVMKPRFGRGIEKMRMINSALGKESIF